MRKTLTTGINKPQSILRSNLHSSPHSSTTYALALYDDHLTLADGKGMEKQIKLEFSLTFEIVEAGQEREAGSGSESSPKEKGNSSRISSLADSAPRFPCALKLIFSAQ